MNCENIKKGDKVVVFFQSVFTGRSQTVHTVKRVYKKHSSLTTVANIGRLMEHLIFIRLSTQTK